MYVKVNPGAAEALFEIDSMDAEEIGRRAMKIAASKCVYTNSSFITQLIDADHKPVVTEKDHPEDAKSSY